MTQSTSASRGSLTDAPGTYVHGYDDRERERLEDQAGALVSLLHHDSRFPPGARILEAGCGVGAQTVTLATNSPEAHFVSIDISPESVRAAQQRSNDEGITNVEFHTGDLFALPFPDASFDHVFVCFVLEHLPRPVDALTILRRVVKPGGTITVIEGDHGSTFFHPDNADAHAAVQCQVELQRRAGGNANIGRQLYPLLVDAGFTDPSVSPRLVYVDGSRPDLIDRFTRKTFTAMIEGVRTPSVEAKLITAERFDSGVAALHRTAALDGMFSYTFFKATARVGE